MKSPSFVTISASPLNGAPAPEHLAASHITAAEHFFVRTHAPVPDPRPPIIELGGLVTRKGDFDLAGLPRTSVEATLQCAGNRRCGLIAHRDIPNEVPWTNEAIGNAVWEGVSLAAILDRAGVTERLTRDLHVWFRGADPVEGKGTGEPFGASIPFEKAMSPQVIVADTMNGDALTPEHGAPLRVIVPGYIGARSVKWLTEIRVEREMTPNYFQAAYSIRTASSQSPSVLGPLPVNAAFALPDAVSLAHGRHRVTGWAMGGGDATVVRVQVSADGGSSWTDARFTSPERRYVWRLWEAELDLAPGSRELVCRAFDSSGATQPAHVGDVWNSKGYLNNSWHRVRATVA